jgi:hypothetical protein
MFLQALAFGLRHCFWYQILEFLTFDMRKKRQTQAGRLPLSPGATLTWLGFSEAGCLSTYDSEAWLLDPLPLSNHSQMVE